LRPHPQMRTYRPLAPATIDQLLMNLRENEHF